MLHRLQASLNALTTAEQRVAKLVLGNPCRFVQMPISEIADRAHVSKPTVVRFCQSMGYDGLLAFKRNLASEAQEGVPFIHPSIDPHDKIDHVLVKVIDNSVATFQRCRCEVSPTALEQAIDALEAAHHGQGRIEFYGVGDSGVVAQDAQHKFFRLGVNSIAYSDGHMQVMSASLRRPPDVVVAISNSGRTRDLIDAAQIGRANGATVIVITASDSPLATLGHIHLTADHPEGYAHYSPMSSRLLHLLIIDVLATGLALRLGAERLQPLLQSAKVHLHSHRYL